MPAQDLTITALWEINSYKLTIKFDNGLEDDVEFIEYGTDLAIEDPIREGYTFSGWDKEIPTKMQAQDLTITALWEINSYKLTIKLDNGQEDDVRFIDYYKESLNKWLDAREKVLETLDGEEKQNFLRTDNDIRYFCMMHIKNAFQFYIPENDDYYDAWFVSSIYNFQTPEDSVRYGRNWFQKSIDLEKY
jgi:hypothetical protein